MRRPLPRRIAGRLWRESAPLRNAGFRSRLRFDRDAPALLLSPHLDDAVIDCWSVLTSPGPVQVVNICGRAPRPGRLAMWDEICGAKDSAEHFAERIAEDREALGLASRAPINLPFLEAQHREARMEPSFRQLDRALTERVPAASTVYAPAALGTEHPDHALARSFALRLNSFGMPVRLYADVPYCVMLGWPHWVTGADKHPRLDVDAYWRPSLAEVPGIEDGDRAEVVRLAEEQASAKLNALRTYRTQFAHLDRGALKQLSNPEIHRYEVFWTLP